MGGINPSAAAAGYSIQAPSSVAWQPGTATGSLTFQYLNPTTNTGPLQAGAKSGTIVVITNEPTTTMPFVSVQNANPQTGYPQAYAPDGGTIAQVPGPRARHPDRLGGRDRRAWPGPSRPPQSPGGLIRSRSIPRRDAAQDHPVVPIGFRNIVIQQAPPTAGAVARGFLRCSAIEISRGVAEEGLPHTARSGRDSASCSREGSDRARTSLVNFVEGIRTIESSRPLP